MFPFLSNKIVRIFLVMVRGGNCSGQMITSCKLSPWQMVADKMINDGTCESVALANVHRNLVTKDLDQSGKRK